MNYIRDHWYGRQSLAWSFWVNLALLRAAIFSLERFTQPPFIQDTRLIAVVTVLFFIFFHVIVFAWQIVGVLRAGDVFLQRAGSTIWVPAAHVGVIASVILTSVSAFAAIQTLFVTKPNQNIAETWERERAGQYALALSADGRLVHLSGNFELGITRSLTKLLAQHPAVQGVVLSSDGGYVVEGRGVAKLIKARGLDTYVYDVCKSACTTAFIGGRERSMGDNGRLGFHQYWLEDGYPDSLLDPRQEQEKDREFFQQQGIKPAFLKRVFDKPHNDIWFPSLPELLQSGVVQRILHAAPVDAPPPTASTEQPD